MTVSTLALSVVAALQDAAVAADTVAARPQVAARGFRFLIGAYSVVWIILAAYLLTLSERLRRLSKQVHRLKERAGS
jgi:CcmD family protein